MSMGKLENLPEDKNLKVHRIGILDDIDSAFQGMDAVIHLSALTRPRESMENPLETDHVNVQGTVKVLLHSRDAGVKRVVFVSSAATYGSQEKLPIKEDAIQAPASPYALTKLIGEQYCELFGEIYGMEINRVRPFNVYGARQDPKGGYAAAVPKFIDMLSKGKTPFITGNGEQYRDFVYVEDVVNVIVAASQSKVYGEAFNAASGKSTSINKLYKIISKIMEKDVKPEYKPAVLEPMTQASMYKTRSLLKVKPSISLKVGLLETIR